MKEPNKEKLIVIASVAPAPGGGYEVRIHFLSRTPTHFATKQECADYLEQFPGGIVAAWNV